MSQKRVGHLDVGVTVQAAAYATGELVGGANGAIAIANAAGNLRTGRIRSVLLSDRSNQKSALEVHFFSTNPSNSTYTENGAHTVHDTDLEYEFAYVALAQASYISFADNAVICVGGLDFPYVADADRKIYAVIISRGSPTYVATTDLNLKIGIEYDA